MFRFLSRKIKLRMDRVSAILIARARLHNFFMQDDRPLGGSIESVEEEMEKLGITPLKNAPFGMSYLPVVPTDDFKMPDGISYTREGIVQALCDQEISRPAHNLECRKREPTEQYLQLSNRASYC